MGIITLYLIYYVEILPNYIKGSINFANLKIIKYIIEMSIPSHL